MTLGKCDVDAQKVHSAMTSHHPQREAKSEIRAVTDEQHVSCTSVQELSAHGRPRPHPRTRPDEREEASDEASLGLAALRKEPGLAKVFH